MGQLHTGGEQSYSGELFAAHARTNRAPLSWKLRNAPNRFRSLGQLASAAAIGKVFGTITFKPQLAAKHFRPSALAPERMLRLQQLLRQNVPVDLLVREFGGNVTDYGVLSRRVVTTAGVNYLVDAWQNLTELENLKYHGVGTGTNAEASGDTALQTESTTILNPDSTRATGSLTEGASANIFRTVGTVTFDGVGAITEHGLFSQAATGGGTLWDRSVFAALTTAAADSIQFTYDMTASAGG